MLNILALQTIKLLRREIIVKAYDSSRYKSTYKQWKKIRMANEPSLPSRADPIIAKLESSEFRSIFTPELQSLASLFKKYNYQLRIAGGAVRDILMGQQPKDLDFATDATPEQMKEMFEKEKVRMINTKGEKHGTITARLNDKENFEVTTLRVDIMTNGRHAEVEFTKDWKRDANRRDLTINSMFLDLDGKLYDYFYGYEDLAKKRIVFVGEPSIRIREDYLRIFRYFRFCGKLKDNPDQHDEATIMAIKENIGGLQQISGQRIWSEWNKILAGKYAMELMLKLLECDSARYIGLPEKPDIENFRVVCQRALSNGLRLKPISMIVSMLKDQHEVMNLYDRLKLPNSDRDLALFLIQHREYKPCEQPLKPYQQLVFIQQTNRYDIYVDYVKETLKYRGAMELLNEFEKWVIPKFPISGAILKNHVSHPRMISRIMHELKRIWVDEDFKLTSDQLIAYVPRILNELEYKIN